MTIRYIFKTKMTITPNLVIYINTKLKNFVKKKLKNSLIFSFSHEKKLSYLCVKNTLIFF